MCDSLLLILLFYYFFLWQNIRKIKDRKKALLNKSAQCSIIFASRHL
uniref:Uncharacterized protein n=1 Tax=Anguilla anguilla TaxID=7936 RepID=A0A0E9UZ11_ANGAN